MWLELEKPSHSALRNNLRVDVLVVTARREAPLRSTADLLIREIEPAVAAIFCIEEGGGLLAAWDADGDGTVGARDVDTLARMAVSL